MAIDKVVDSAALDAQITQVANALRQATGESEQLVWPTDIISGIQSLIPTVNWEAEYKKALTGQVAEIPENTTELRAYAFYKFLAMTNAMLAALPDALETIGDYCFAGCTGITAADLSGKSIESIGNNAFADCTALQSIDLSDNDLQTLGQYLCPNDAVFASIDLSDNSNLKVIPAYFAYRSTGGTLAVDITDSPIESIGAYAFYSTSSSRSSLAWLEACATVKSIGNFAFYSKAAGQVSELDLSGTAIETIGENAFQSAPSSGIAGYQSIVFPASLKSIGVNAFQGNLNQDLDFSRCSLLESIGNTAFRVSGTQACSTLDLSACSSLQTIGQQAFSYNANNKLTIGALTLPSHKLASIGQQAFQNCGLANTATLTVNCENIGKQAFDGSSGPTKLIVKGAKTLGGYCFAAMANLTEIHFTDTPTTLPTGSETVFGNRSTVDIYVPWSSGDLAENKFFGSSSTGVTWHYDTPAE